MKNHILLCFALLTGMLNAQTNQLVAGVDYLQTTSAKTVHAFSSLADVGVFSNLQGGRIRVEYGSPKYMHGVSFGLSYQHLRMTTEGTRKTFIFNTRYKGSTKVWFPELSIKYSPLFKYWVSPYLQMGIGKGIMRYDFVEFDSDLGYASAAGRYFKDTWYFPACGVLFRLPQGHQFQLGYRTTFKTAFGRLPQVSIGYGYAFDWD